MPAIGTAQQTARSYLMTTACAGTFAFGTFVAFLGATLPELRTRIGFDIQQSGTLISLLFLPQVPMSFVAGPLIDRFGKKPVLASGSLLCAVVLAAISLVHSYQVLAILVFVLGRRGQLHQQRSQYASPGHLPGKSLCQAQPGECLLQPGNRGLPGAGYIDGS